MLRCVTRGHDQPDWPVTGFPSRKRICVQFFASASRANPRRHLYSQVGKPGCRGGPLSYLQRRRLRWGIRHQGMTGPKCCETVSANTLAGRPRLLATPAKTSGSGFAKSLSMVSVAARRPIPVLAAPPQMLTSGETCQEPPRCSVPRRDNGGGGPAALNAPPQGSAA
jgi:hypothetical protein